MLGEWQNQGLRRRFHAMVFRQMRFFIPFWGAFLYTFPVRLFPPSSHRNGTLVKKYWHRSYTVSLVSYGNELNFATSTWLMVIALFGGCCSSGKYLIIFFSFMKIVTEDGAELYPVCHFNVAINSLVDGDEEGFEALKCIVH